VTHHGLTWSPKGSIVLLIGLGLAAWLTAGDALAEPPLRLHYMFDQIEDGRAQDLSGYDNHGTIHGAAAVDTARGPALRFDGVDDYVDCGADPSLRLRGDMTIEMWLRTDVRDNPQRNRLLFGEAASLGVQRNYNLRLNYERMRFEWADGARNSNNDVVVPLFDGRWHHLAYVVESPNAHYVYLDGQLVSFTQQILPVTPTTQSAARHIGGWFAGWFEGEIAEVRVHARSLPVSEILERSEAPSSDAASLRVEAGYVCASQRLQAQLLLTAPRAEAPRARVALVPADLDAAPVLTREVAFETQTRPGSGRWRQRLLTDTPDLPPGPYLLVVQVLDQQRPLTSVAEPVNVIATPSWVHSDAGRSDRVLPPYRPLQTTSGDEGVVVESVNHRYRFAKHPIVSAIRAGGHDILAAPPTLTVRADGEDQPASPAPPTVEQAGQARVAIEQRMTAPGVRLRARSTIEYDGFIKVELTAEAQRDTTLERLVLTVPLKAEHARYVNTWPTTHSGAFDEDLRFEFRPILNVLGNDGGLSWIAESDRHWRPASSPNAIELLREDKVVHLRFNLVAEPIALREGEAVRYVFGLQGLPVKPREAPDAWDYRVVRIDPYGREFKWPQRMIDQRNAIEHYVHGGARGALVLRPWTVFAYPTPIGEEQRFRELMQACHREGLQAIPYFGGFLISERAPEFAAFKNDFRKMPPQPFRIIHNRVPGLDGQMCYHACPKGAWQPFLCDGAVRLIEDHDADGVYLDSATMPHPCANLAHGCGYERADGAVAPTYPVFATRTLIKRLYTIVKTRKPDGHVDVHPYDGLMPPALSFATVTWSGEHLYPPKPEHIFDVLPLDRFRAELMNRNLGLNMDLLYYKIGDYDAAAGLGFLHDIPTRSEKDHTFAVESAIWKLRKSVGGDAATWHPYWEGGGGVMVTPEKVYASAYRHPERGALIVLFNGRREPVTARVTAPWSGAATLHRLHSRDGSRQRPIEPRDGRYPVDLEVEGWAAIRIAPP